jgi:hypothetical protein
MQTVTQVSKTYFAQALSVKSPASPLAIFLGRMADMATSGWGIVRRAFHRRIPARNIVGQTSRMLDQTPTLPEDPEELRNFTARFLAEVKAQAILIESEESSCAAGSSRPMGGSK